MKIDMSSCLGSIGICVILRPKMSTILNLNVRIFFTKLAHSYDIPIKSENSVSPKRLGICIIKRRGGAGAVLQTPLWLNK